jgi:hypothetical protein
VVCREETLLRDSFVIATAARPLFLDSSMPKAFGFECGRWCTASGGGGARGGYAGGGAPRAALTAIEEVMRTALPQHRQHVGDGRD